MLLTYLNQSMSSSTELCTVYECYFTHFLILGRDEKKMSKSSLLEAIDVPRKVLDESIMLRENSQVYECIAAKYPEDLEVVMHPFNIFLTYASNQVICMCAACTFLCIVTHDD